MPNENINTQYANQQEDEINLLDIFIVLLKHKKLIISITGIAAILSIIISLILPPVYEAKTSIMPPLGISRSSSMSAAAAALGLGAIAKNPSDVYVDLLKSNFVVDNIIKEFNLTKLYKAKNIDIARKDVLKHLDAKADLKTGIITIGYKDKDPKRAAQIANAFVDQLRYLNNHLAVTKAAVEKRFFQKELKKAYKKLLEAEKNAESFQKKTGVIELKPQAQASINTIANLKAQIAAQEAKLAAMSTYATPQNPDYKKTEASIASLEAELSALESNAKSSALPSIKKVPEVYGKYINIQTELGFRKAVYSMLLKLYQQASIQEAKGAPLIQVIDKATPPHLRISPKRTLIVVVSTLAAFFISIFIAFIKEAIERMSQNEEDRKRLELIKKYASFGKKA